MSDTTRRAFVKKAAAAGFVAAPAIRTGWGADRPGDRINIAVVGFRSRGREHYTAYAKMPNARVTHLCDIDERLFATAAAEVESISGHRPETVVDFRELIKNKDIDAVSIATPDHWHALHAVWACQAGKDVYVEKPVSYCLAEGRKIVQAARKYDRVVQVGLQTRSDKRARSAIRFVRDGKLGPAYRSKVALYRGRIGMGRVQEASIPEGVHWDLFLGPAPYRAYTESRFHYGWHYFWDTSTSEIGNNGVHNLDVVRWGLAKDRHPTRIHCMGGLFADPDTDQQTPNTAVAAYQYDDGVMVDLDMTTLYSPSLGGVDIGVFFYTPKGYISPADNWKTVVGEFTTRDRPGVYPGVSERASNLSFPDIAYHPGPEIPDIDEVEVTHFENFISAVRAHDRRLLHCEVEEGHMSTSLCHLANISMRVGRSVVFDPDTETFPKDPEANALLTRKYREPFVMPAEV